MAVCNNHVQEGKPRLPILCVIGRLEEPARCPNAQSLSHTELEELHQPRSHPIFPHCVVANAFFHFLFPLTTSHILITPHRKTHKNKFSWYLQVEVKIEMGWWAFFSLFYGVQSSWYFTWESLGLILIHLQILYHLSLLSPIQAGFARTSR